MFCTYYSNDAVRLKRRALPTLIPADTFIFRSGCCPSKNVEGFGKYIRRKERPQCSVQFFVVTRIWEPKGGNKLHMEAITNVFAYILTKWNTGFIR